jgi:hypothetical protein
LAGWLIPETVALIASIGRHLLIAGIYPKIALATGAMIFRRTAHDDAKDGSTFLIG